MQRAAGKKRYEVLCLERQAGLCNSRNERETGKKFMIIRPFGEKDQEGIKSLFKACFGKEMSTEEWTWKYKNSYLGSSAAVAEDDGRIIAHYGGLKMCFHYNGGTLDAYQGCDAMTHPEYQSRGIIVKTALGFYEAYPGREFMFGFPSERHAMVAKKWLGWEKHVFISEMIKEVSRFSLRRSPWRVDTGWDRIAAGEINALWARTKDSRNLSLEKKSDYIYWRYRDCPGKEYEIILFRGRLVNDLKAYAVVLEQKDELRVLDLIASRSMKAKKLMGCLEQRAAAKGMKTIRLWMNPHERECGELRDAGYREEKGIPLTLRIFEGSDFSPACFFEQYNYSMGDYDAA